MEDSKHNANDALNKKDKRRYQIQSRLSKMTLAFSTERDNYYRSMLHDLQNTLSTMHSGTNEVFLESLRDFEETRDYEMTRLRLWEEYQVQCVEREFHSDLVEAKTEHNQMVRLVKEKLQENLAKKIKALKEDKILLDMINSNTSSSSSQFMANSMTNLAFDRRSLRKRDIHPSHHLDTEEVSDSGYTSSLKRRRGGYGSGRDSGRDSRPNHNILGRGFMEAENGHATSNAYSSNDESGVNNGNGTDIDGYESLNNLIFGEKQREKPNTRHNAKPGDKITSLRPEDVDEDMEVLRAVANGVKKRETAPSLTPKRTRPPLYKSRRFWSCICVFTILYVYLHRFNLYPDVAGVNQSDLLGLPSSELKYYPVSRRVSKSHRDFPFKVGCSVPAVDEPRANAALVVLARNSELPDVIASMKSLERHFNQWFNYPWVFLNDEPFTEEFKEKVKAYTASDVEFGVIEPQHWDFPAGVDRQLIKESIEYQGDRGIKYGKLESYHKMCRFYSGWFFKHPLVAKRDWYWRVEPKVEFYCDITYDPFVEMEKRGKKYGFTVMIKELVDTIPNLFRYTQLFIRSHNVTVGETWGLFLRNHLHIHGDHAFTVETEEELRDEIDFETRLQKLLDKRHSMKDGMIDKNLLERLVKANASPSKLRRERFNAQEYNMCHFWLNFEIARTSLFNSTEYQAYFNFLENSGGFYAERWGDAPIHSLAVGMFLELDDVHYFRDIGYKHSTLGHCPANARGKQLPYEAAESYTAPKSLREYLFERPDPARLYGVGCRCRCPTNHREIEDSLSSCMNKWFELIDDNYTESVVDLAVVRRQHSVEVQDDIERHAGQIVYDGPWKKKK
ncbi:glycosyltransferase family 15 protein [Babjeviella inositovora NRRL Y-12698]|uniref:Glycosyltransferase family 15 protein n=1 Tax=Babjeviella inositovora NRRL Y-12698 TaxID=984486 RepID=A0A1E3QUU4_9ASCO|nr:glycosyltransferase family 15 protein [Babjeviella inositovora NRRL Y-12698]ODQ81456.1 glycosyltransferase family 15 protein [Babjeviella inositovora NRRL Y-12698]